MTKIDLSEWGDWIDAQDVMLKMQISASTLQRWRLNNMLPYSRLHGKYYYRKSDIIALLNENYSGEKGGSEDEE